MVFSSNKKASTKVNRRALLNDGGGVTILTSGCHFNGKLYCRGSSRIGGQIDGEIISDGVLIIEEGAIINASIKAEEVFVQGRVVGRLESTARVELAENSSFMGDIITPALVIQEGALFNGKALMQNKKLAEIEEIHTKSKDIIHSHGINKAPVVGPHIAAKDVAVAAATPSKFDIPVNL